jgi:hypothetical protein
MRGRSRRVATLRERWHSPAWLVQGHPEAIGADNDITCREMRAARGGYWEERPSAWGWARR